MELVVVVLQIVWLMCQAKEVEAAPLLVMLLVALHFGREELEAVPVEHLAQETVLLVRAAPLLSWNSDEQ